MLLLKKSHHNAVGDVSRVYRRRLLHLVLFVLVTCACVVIKGLQSHIKGGSRNAEYYQNSLQSIMTACTVALAACL